MVAATAVCRITALVASLLGVGCSRTVGNKVAVGANVAVEAGRDMSVGDGVGVGSWSAAVAVTAALAADCVALTAVWRAAAMVAVWFTVGVKVGVASAVSVSVAAADVASSLLAASTGSLATGIGVLFEVSEAGVTTTPFPD